MHGDLKLVSKYVGPMPIVNHYIGRLRLESIISSNVMPGRGVLSAPDTIMLLLRNIIVERAPMYGMNDWASSFHPHALRLSEEQLNALNDDRTGKALDALFDADRASMMTGIAVRAIREFGIDLGRFHNDTTTVTFHGRYRKADGRRERGKETVKITFGHNKDHRPDLKQLLWSLTVSSDGAVPVHYRVYDGNTQDAVTHIQVWEAVCGIACRKDFIYVADSKLCVGDTMRYIDSRGGRFITVLPATRGEDMRFREYLQENEAAWRDVPPKRKRSTAVEYRVVESPIPASDGFRLIWVWSRQKAETDRESRESAMSDAAESLLRLNSKVNAKWSRIRTRDGVVREAEKAVSSARRYISYSITEKEETGYRQARPGRPSSGTEYRRVTRKRFVIDPVPIVENVEFDSPCDGIFPLLTNCRDMSAEKVLENYKFQPRLEKRHEQLKSVYAVMPVLFKNVRRIESILFIYFVAMLVQSLIERETRLSMKRERIRSIPIYHESRECEFPTAERLLSSFGGVQIHRLSDAYREVQVFQPELTPLQERLLKLMGVDRGDYVLAAE